jgi:alanine racemase
MTSYSTGDIAKITGCNLVGNPSHRIRQICTDSRRIDQPGESLFIALKGPNHDGHRFLIEAFNFGIRSFLVSELPEPLDQFSNSAFIIAPNPLSALQNFATWHRNKFTGQLIAITGSNGKTIIKEWLAQLMQSAYRISKNPKSYNSQLGVPLSILNLAGDEEYAILEAGISMPGEMSILQKILDPDIGIISNIGDAHQENFENLTQKVSEKLILFKNCKKILYCRDHKLIHNHDSLALFSGQKVTWSRSQSADLLITTELISGSTCQLKGIFKNKSVNLIIPFADPASVENMIHIWLFVLTLGFDQANLQTQVAKLEPIRMRLEQKAGINRCTLINDYYNSDILSLKIALDLLFQQTPQQRKTIILSDILQTGLKEEILYQEINNLFEHRNLYRLIGIGSAFCKNAKLFSQPILTYISTADFLNQVNANDFHDEAILLKGARSFAFEQIGRIFEARIHATTMEIRMNDVRFNLGQYRKLVGPDVKIMAMVKAFSYGSGGTEMAKFLAHERIDYLGVAFADEGIEIRRAGIKTPVMVMNPDLQQSEMIIEHHLEPEIYNWAGLTKFADTLRNSSPVTYPVHIKLDTGMHRLGFDYQETKSLSNFLNKHPELFLKSVFSHLAASENPENDDFTDLQIKRFSNACDQIQQNTGYTFLRHILNSSGIERFPLAHFDMVRLGIGLYGIGNTNLLNLHPITTLKTIISQVHHLTAGESVGYGRRTILQKPTQVGVIPIGYADGIDRRLGNGNYQMLVKGKPAITVGNICMDMTIIDLTGMEANEGDEVIVFGPENTVSSMAEILNTIPYEVLTSISPRVKRIYQFE